MFVTRLNWWRGRRLTQNASLVLFKKGANPNEYGMLATAATNFFLGRQQGTLPGELDTVLIMDEDAVLTASVIKLAIGCDISDGTRTIRYKFKTKTPPTDASPRWVCVLTGNQSDVTVIA